MPYTVASSDAGNTQYEFDTYLRLLGQRGIDWTDAERIDEPGTKNRWGYVWDNESDAQEFCEELKSSTGNGNWSVRELERATEISHGPLMPVIIHRNLYGNGYVFQLHPHSRSAIRKRFPESRPLSNLSIEYTTLDDFESTHGSIYDHVALALTGLSHEQVGELGGYQILDLKAKQTVFDATHEVVK